MPYVRANSAYCGSSPARAEPMQTARQSISRKKRLFISATIGECQYRAGTMRIQTEQSPPGDTNIAFLTEPLKKELTSSAPPIHLPPPLPAGPHQPPFEQRPAPTRQYPLASGRYPSPPGTKKGQTLVGRPRLNVCFTARKALLSKPLLSRRGLGWLSASVGGVPPIQGQTPKLLQVHGGRPVPCWAQKKVRPCKSDLEEAATYSPTG